MRFPFFLFLVLFRKRGSLFSLSRKDPRFFPFFLFLPFHPFYLSPMERGSKSFTRGSVTINKRHGIRSFPVSDVRHHPINTFVCTQERHVIHSWNLHGSTIGTKRVNDTTHLSSNNRKTFVYVREEDARNNNEKKDEHALRNHPFFILFCTYLSLRWNH